MISTRFLRNNMRLRKCKSEFEPTRRQPNVRARVSNLLDTATTMNSLHGEAAPVAQNPDAEEVQKALY